MQSSPSLHATSMPPGMPSVSSSRSRSKGSSVLRTMVTASSSNGAGGAGTTTSLRCPLGDCLRSPVPTTVMPPSGSRSTGKSSCSSSSERTPAWAALDSLGHQDTGFDYDEIGMPRTVALGEMRRFIESYPQLAAMWRAEPIRSNLTLEQAG